MESGTGGAVSDIDISLNVQKTDSSGIIGEYYNQIATKIVTQSGNYRQAVYDDSSAPNALLANTGSLTIPATGYNYESLTEFALSTTAVWLAVQPDNSTARLNRTGGVYTNGDGKLKTYTYGTAFPNPAGSGYSDVNYKWVQKINHS